MAASVQECSGEDMGVPSDPKVQGLATTEHTEQASAEGPDQNNRPLETKRDNSAPEEHVNPGAKSKKKERILKKVTTVNQLLKENGTETGAQSHEDTANGSVMDLALGCSAQHQNTEEGPSQLKETPQTLPSVSENMSPAPRQRKKLGRSRKNPTPKKLQTEPQPSDPGPDESEMADQTQTPPPKVYKKRGRKSKAELMAVKLEKGLTGTPEPVDKKNAEKTLIEEEETTSGGRPKRRAAKAALLYLHNLAEEMGATPHSSAPERATAKTEPGSEQTRKSGRGRKRKKMEDDGSDDVSKDADFVLSEAAEETDSEDAVASCSDSDADVQDLRNKACSTPSTPHTRSKFVGLAANGLPNNIMGPVWICTHLTKEFREEHHSSWVFPEWIPSVKDWNFLSSRDAEKYLPKEEQSVPFRINREGYKEDPGLHTIRRFDSLSSHPERWDSMFFVGGPVWSMEWCPCPEGAAASQYAAIFCNRDMDERHRIVETHAEPALLQIWEVGDLQHDTCPSTKPSFAYGIALDNGCIWDMKWCPSGTWELPSSIRKVPQMPRLGLLAAAFSNGTIAVFSLPHTEALVNYRRTQCKGAVSQAPMICQVQCAAVLKVGSIHASSNSHCGQCFCLDWLPMKPHNILAAGFYDGSVAFWNLATKSLLQRVRVGNDRLTLYPYHCFIAHDHAVRAVNWCKVSSNFIVTASEDRKVKFWDLRRPYEPLNVFKRYLTTEISWLLYWCGVCVAQENCYTTYGMNGVHYIDAGYTGSKPYFVAPRRGTVWSISGSDWLNTCVTTDSTGELLMMLLADMSQNPYIKRPMDRRFPIYRVELVPYGTDSKVQEEDNKNPVNTGQVCEPQTYGEAIKKYYLLFRDTDMRTFKNASSREPMKHMQATETKGALALDRMPLDALYKARFNPNLGAHGWVLSAGQSGIVRAHCLRGMNSPVITKLVRESQAQFNAMYQPQGDTANEFIVTAVQHRVEAIVEVQ
ncbi:general transcription factor 3C polypeptide 2 [Lepisosteus oculatus]|uniref:General transcription factor 3C polypeptide 2 n=1 Tax=Lepisosteus oculatus TaxID=7918 RepID=W5NFV2_LEPOC|nr:PREDICTED: general transcription factor 3C polypeptide 2 [Lepisosteus oculatus]XP_015201809.1 PREDICTED: general transcription factor 3C polypeptide 2 [Lepisosteus oculatus]